MMCLTPFGVSTPRHPGFASLVATALPAEHFVHGGETLVESDERGVVKSSRSAGRHLARLSGYMDRGLASSAAPNFSHNAFITPLMIASYKWCVSLDARSRSGHSKD